MNSMVKDPGSFRDPGSQVYSDREHVLRAVYPSSAADYEAFRNSGLLDQLILEERLVPSEEVNAAANPGGQVAAYVLRHPRLPFISYAYEWPFGLLKNAALFQIDILLTALDRGFTLSDATAYNVQFVGTKPIFVDHLSFRPYREGEIWAAHRQFCMQFLNPIVLWSRFGIAPNSWFRGSLEGIEPEQLAPLLRWRDRLSPTMFSHIILQGMFQQRANSGKARDIPAQETKISRESFKVMLSGLRSFIERARMPQRRSAWDEYASDNSYSGAEAEAKNCFVRRMAATVKPGVVIDLGCNTGDYSIAALEAGAGQAVGFDFDFGALEQAVTRADTANLHFLPLWLDATNPSPDQGWAQKERKGFAERVRGDAVLALAFIHHLAIARNVPLPMVIDWVMSIAPVGVIEFTPKTDPMVQLLLRNRTDIFPDYAQDQFLACIERRARIIDQEQLSPGGRLLVWYDAGKQVGR
jgi:ribosomal protein L11 methylase PrmA